MTEIIIALVTLTFLEIVLGIDNVIFISILSGKYIYFAMGFSVFVEMINIRVRKKGTPVELHRSYDRT